MPIELDLLEPHSKNIEVEPHRPLREVAKLMTDNAVGTVTVTASRGVVVGSLSPRDIIRAIAWRGAEALDDAACAHMASLYSE